MPEQRRPPAVPRLAAWLLATVLLTVIVFVTPGIWWMKRAFENSIVREEMSVSRKVHDEWAIRLTDRIVSAEASAQRLGRLFSERIAQKTPAADAADFDRLVAREPDGCWRSRHDTFDPGRHAGVWVPASHAPDAAERAFLMHTKRLVELYHVGTTADLVNTWMITRNGSSVMMWPSSGNFIRELKFDFDYTAVPSFTLVTPARNPEHATRWAEATHDPATGIWRTSAVAPVLNNGEFVGSVGNDVALNVLINSTHRVVLHEGSHYYLVRADGTLLMSDAPLKAMEEHRGTLGIKAIGDVELLQAFEAINKRTSDAEHTSVVFGDSYSPRIIIATRLQGPGWSLLSVVPRTSIIDAVQGSYRKSWVVGAAGLFAMLFLPLVMISRVTLPSIRHLLKGADRIHRGDLEHHFNIGGTLELQQIGEALNTMVSRIRASIEERSRTQAVLVESEANVRATLAELQSSLAVIGEQRDAIRSLSTPILHVWDDVLALPIIGILDSTRAAALMDTLLRTITTSRTRVAILDLTGVATIDDATAEHLMRVMQAVNLLGAKGIVSGVQADMAQRMLALEIDLSSIIIYGSLQEAIEWCMRRPRHETRR